MGRGGNRHAAVGGGAGIGREQTQTRISPRQRHGTSVLARMRYWRVGELEKEFPDRVFSDRAGVVRTLQAGLPRLPADTDRVRSSGAGPGIIRLALNAH